LLSAATPAAAAKGPAPASRGIRWSDTIVVSNWQLNVLVAVKRRLEPAGGGPDLQNLA
jgi:hypothetical protein